MVGLNHCGFSAETALNYIRVNGSLCQEIHSTDFLRLFLKNTDEFLTDNLTLCFRLGHACQLLIVTLLGVDTDKVQVKLAVRSEDLFYLIALIFTKETVIHKYTGQLLTDGSGQKSCCHRGIHAAGQSQQYATVSYLRTNIFNRVFNKSIHLPVACALAYLLYEVINHLRTLGSMQYLWVELDSIKLLSFILSGCHRAVCSVGCDFKAGCHLRNIVKVAHPADSLRTYALKHLGRSLVDEHFSLTILSHIRALHLAPEHMAHELRAIAQTQHRNTKLEQLVRVGR